MRTPIVISQRRISLVAAALVAFTASGCDLFATRTPENPVNAGSGFEPALTPSLVLRNLESAFNYANASDYRKCFSDSGRGTGLYTFMPSVEGLAAAPDAFADWGVAQEEEYVRNLFGELREGSVASVSFTPAEVTAVPIADSVQFTAEYLTRVPHTRQGVPTEVSGTLEFTFRRSQQNQWVITSWRDISRSDRPSWSLLKARFIDR